MFKADINRKYAKIQKDVLGTYLMPLINAITAEDINKIGELATRMRLACLNLEAIAQTENEGWKATERKRMKVDAAYLVLRTFLEEHGCIAANPEGSPENDARYPELAMCVGQMLEAAAKEYPVTADIIPPNVWQLYKKICKKEGRLMPDRRFKEGSTSTEAVLIVDEGK